MSIHTAKKEQHTVQRLLEIIKLLRDPKDGCPWDNRQTFASLIPYMLEESYEVADAIERKDYADLKLELGDLLFQIVFYAQLAAEQELFDFQDICQGICDKLEHRHPHIFQKSDVSLAQSVDWEQQKYNERKLKQQMSVLDDIPVSLPALMKAQKIQKRCASVGFDWPNIEPVLDKVHEEIDEVMHEALQSTVNETKLEEELGDLLFSVVNLTRHFGFKAEIALQKANRKFEHRFRQVEEHIIDSGQDIHHLSLEEMELIWQKIKK